MILPLLKKVRFFFQALFLLGAADTALSEDSQKKIILTNQIALVLMAVASPYFFVFKAFHASLLSQLMIPIILLLSLTFLCNAQRWYFLAKLLVIGVPSIGCMFYASVLGIEAGIQNLYIAVLILPLTIIEFKKEFQLGLGLIFPLLCYLILEFSHYHLGERLLLPAFILSVIRITIASVTCFISFASVGFYFSQHKQSQEELLSINQNLKDSHHNLQLSHTKLQTAYEELQQSQSMIDSLSQQAAMGALVRGIAHEVKNPLVAIYSSCANLLAVPLDDSIQVEIKAIQSSVFQLDYLTNNLLSHSGKMVVGNQWIQLNDILTQLLKLVDNEAFVRKITLHRQLQKSLPQIKGNAPYISQAVLNLLVNALEHTPKGSISVRSHTFIEKGSLRVGVQVQDTGNGIPEDVLPHIFNLHESFRKSRLQDQPTSQINAGLGLFFVKRVMDAHNGEVRVYSVEGKGTQFELVFQAEIA